MRICILIETYFELFDPACVFWRGAGLATFLVQMQNVLAMCCQGSSTFEKNEGLISNIDTVFSSLCHLAWWSCSVVLLNVRFAHRTAYSCMATVSHLLPLLLPLFVNETKWQRRKKPTAATAAAGQKQGGDLLLFFWLSLKLISVSHYTYTCVCLCRRAAACLLYYFRLLLLVGKLVSMWILHFSCSSSSRNVLLLPLK